MLTTIYKLLAKMITTRMTPILNSIVSPHQHEFIKGRSIYDNILTAMVGMEYAQFTKQECILLQLDLDKAYDWITWSFVSEVLKKFGFGPRICNSIFTMGEGSPSVVLFNIVVMGEFQVKRSFQQGCPLASLLFAICTHPLAALLEAPIAKKEISRLCLPNAVQLLIHLNSQ